MAVKFEGCYAKHQTDKALLVEIPEIDTEPQWVPQQHITDDSEVYRKGDEGTLVVTDWIAESHWYSRLFMCRNLHASAALRSSSAASSLAMSMS